MPRQHFIQEPDRCHRSKRDRDAQILGHITTSLYHTTLCFKTPRLPRRALSTRIQNFDRRHSPEIYERDIVREFKFFQPDTLWDSADAHFHRELIAKDRNPSGCFHGIASSLITCRTGACLSHVASRHRVRPESLNNKVCGNTGFRGLGPEFFFSGPGFVLLIEKHVPVRTIRFNTHQRWCSCLRLFVFASYELRAPESHHCSRRGGKARTRAWSDYRSGSRPS
ncbi:hypothetical protein CY34DRAFT_726797 [Suillus luteus UH-Slu-Lm8-n1]|uniref:Uncharacterized protein n=1 Tax=Suillus luteus UH-Slu-Lm8-n1 TaxID=930992 RepID=A0A0D0AZK6_9AGAM|nr:hypothetical protein CY34DRAFT_726797 [Suillus luteus UH-Slu-Lm8-n1]